VQQWPAELPALWRCPTQTQQPPPSNDWRRNTVSPVRTPLPTIVFIWGAQTTILRKSRGLDPLQACGVKVFMGASTGNMLVDDPVALEQIFTHSPVIVATHCEDSPTIDANTRKAQNFHGDDIPMGRFIRRFVAKRLVIFLPLSRLTWPETVQHPASRFAFEHGQRAGTCSICAGRKTITAEVCVHHLFFSDVDYRKKETLIKCNPAIKTATDRKACWRP
jgi:dihydroorotase